MKEKKDHLIYGINPITQMMTHKHEQVLEIFLARKDTDKRVENILQLAKKYQIPVKRVSKTEIEQWFEEETHQNIAASIKTQPLLNEQDLSTILQDIKGPPLLAILDGIQDPRNFGAILRTAESAGVHVVIAPKDKATTLTSTVRKVASGAAELLPIIFVTNLSRTMNDLKSQGIWFFGGCGEASDSLYQMDFKCGVGLVFGAEGKGLRKLTRENCDYLFHIPMVGQVESLNVSVAAGISIYEALRQRIA